MIVKTKECCRGTGAAPSFCSARRRRVEPDCFRVTLSADRGRSVRCGHAPPFARNKQPQARDSRPSANRTVRAAQRSRAALQESAQLQAAVQESAQLQIGAAGQETAQLHAAVQESAQLQIGGRGTYSSPPSCRPRYSSRYCLSQFEGDIGSC